MVNRPGSGISERKLLSLYCYSAGEYGKALEVLAEIKRLAPDDVESLENTGVILRLLGRQEESVRILREVHELEPDRVNVCDALAHSYANLGDAENSQRFGRLSLEEKDRQATKGKPLCVLPDHAPPPFAYGGAKKHVISFSLWGENPRYTKGAIRNAQAAIDLYPGWTVRFYCDDSVPPGVLSRLGDYGAEIVMRPAPASFFDGLLWRFEVVNDPGVERFLVRDCDSVLCYKERVAVEEWLQSDRWFHVMRDFPSHTEVILAGMWGGVSGVLPPADRIRAHFQPTTAPTRTFDQQLLREVVWPVVRQSVLSHDSVYTGCIGSVPYPELATLPPGFHIGQNEAAVRPSIRADLPAADRFGGRSIFLLSGIDEEAVGFCRHLLEQIDGITVVKDPTVPELRRSVANSLSAVRADKASPGNASPTAFPREEEEIFLALLGSAVSETAGAESRCVGFEDPDGDIAFLSSLAGSSSLKLLCVVRDPRDTASSRRITGVEEGTALGRRWREHLEAVAEVNRKYPETIELVRYEDLSSERSAASIGRVCRFLGLNHVRVTIQTNGTIDSGKPLPGEISEAIRKESAEFLKRLRYREASAGISAVVSKSSSGHE